MDDRPLLTGRALVNIEFTEEDLKKVRHSVNDCAFRCGVAEPRRNEVVLAVHELACNAIVHGGGRGRLRVVQEGCVLHCQVSDEGPGMQDNLLPHRPFDALDENGRGLWICQELSDDMEISTDATGSTVTLAVRLHNNDTRRRPPDGPQQASRPCRAE
ncbi:ATP-binding protein [Streptomyces sp. BH097]|uniref:ATP-binding protein n=1 Tax=unclassified Streptomyces TaxID=2593676 RepID=UPI003BB568AD